MTRTIYSRDDLDLIVAFAGCSLDSSPGSNWVEGAGGLPEYICRIARAIKRTGKTTSQAIAIAVSRVKRWAAGDDDVDAKTRAKAAKAVAAWEALKAKSKARRGTKKVAASQVLALTTTEFNTDTVRAAFNKKIRDAQREWHRNNRTFDESSPVSTAPIDYYIREMWTTYLIVSDGYDERGRLFKVPFTVDDADNVDFGDPQPIKTVYVAVQDDDLSDLTDQQLLDLLDDDDEPTSNAFLSRSTQAAPSAVDRVLKFAAGEPKVFSVDTGS